LILNKINLKLENLNIKKKIKISQLKLSEKNNFYKFIKKNWVKNINLSLTRKVFDWQHKSNKKYNFCIAKDNKKIIGVQGFMPMSHFDSALSKSSLFQVFLRVVDGKYIGTAVLLHQKIISLCDSKFIGVVGIDKITHRFHRWLGFKVFKMEHHFILSEKIKIFKLIKKGNKKFRQKKINKKSDISYDVISLENIHSKIKKGLFKKSFPIKSKNYLINRYLRNPFYNYLIIQINKSNISNSIIVIRPIMHRNRWALRLVDYIGYEKNFKNTHDVCKNLIEKYNAEYLDIYSHGISNFFLKAAGFKNKYNYPDIIIPNYFEPFKKENVDIFCAFKTNIKKKVKLFKGDGDCDRPNVAIP
jgi:hypothetical protein